MKRPRRRIEIEEFSPFDKARFNNGVPNLNEQLAHELLAEVDRHVRLENGKAEDIMEHVLSLHEIWDEEHRHAYKSFFGHSWHARKRQREKDRGDAFKRDFAPIDEDGIYY